MLSEVPEGWQISTLGEVCSPKQHPTIQKTKFTSEGYPVYGANGQIGFFSDYTHGERTLAITCRGATCGTINVVPPKSYITGNAMALDSLDESAVAFDFLNHYLRHFGVDACITGSAQPQITRSSLLPVELALPPLNEQHRIAEILASVDASIQTTQVVIEQAERVKRGLMEELLTGGLGSAAIERGEAPEGWHKTELGRLFVVKSSKRVLQKQWRKEGIPFYRGREITALSEKGFVNNELFIEQELYEEFSSKHGVPKLGDILITAIGTIGNTYLVREDDRFYFKDASVLWLECASDNLSAFVDYWLKSNLFFNQLDAGNGTTVDSLTISKMKSLSIVLPSVDEQKHVAGMLSDVDVLISKQKEIVKQQNRTKRGLMDDLLTGKVRTA
jgi:type I restriction enzyme S subunit